MLLIGSKIKTNNQRKILPDHGNRVRLGGTKKRNAFFDACFKRAAFVSSWKFWFHAADGFYKTPVVSKTKLNGILE